MLDGLRAIACYVLVATIIGGLWTYAVLQQQIRVGEGFRLPPANPALLRRVRELAGNEAWREQPPARRHASPAKPGRDATSVTRVENGE